MLLGVPKGWLNENWSRGRSIGTAMTGGEHGSPTSEDLRKAAEEKAKADQLQTTDSLLLEEPQRLLHQLRAHQIELEMKNEELRRAQGELEVSRARFFDMYDLAPVGYLTIDEQGLIREANLTAATLFGAPRSVLARQPLTRYIAPEDQDLYHRQRQRFAQPGALHAWDMRMKRADGSRFWAHLDAVLTRDGVCLCTLCDATERMRSVEEVRISERRLKEAQRIGKMGSLDWDLSTNTILLSEETLAMYGLDQANARPTLEDITRLLPPDEKERVENSLRTAIAGGARHDMEHRIVRPDGREIFVRATAELFRDPDGKPARLLGTILDITESKAIEDAQSFLLKCGYLPPDEKFFNSLARYLAETLGMDYVCIDRLEGTEQVARTVAVYFDGAFEANVDYCLKDTPCGEVVGKPICVFENGVRHKFPRDLVLQEMKAESYVGTTLWGFDGKPIGLIAVIGRKPLENPRLAETLLKLVAVRAAGELERERAELALRESEERYRVVVESSRELIFFLDPGGRLRWHNQTSRELIGDIAAHDDLFQRVHPDDVMRVASAWRLAQENERQGSSDKVSYRLRAADGRYRTLEGVFRRITFAGEALWCLISTDTTELARLRLKVVAQQGIPGIVGRDPKMLELYASIRRLAEVNAAVLIQGESGTGKELVAAAIHREGPRAGRPFVPINCGALPENLLESELFGHVRGAFTGAVRDKKGRFELADGGSIFLDEIGDLTQAMQVKLLRVLQEGTFERVGGEKTLKVDVRVISATHKNLRSEVAAGRFREDLFSG